LQGIGKENKEEGEGQVVTIEIEEIIEVTTSEDEKKQE